MDLVLKKNKKFKTILNIPCVIKGGYKTQAEYITNNSISGHIASFKYAPLTSCDVKRRFSLYKPTLRAN